MSGTLIIREDAVWMPASAYYIPVMTLIAGKVSTVDPVLAARIDVSQAGEHISIEDLTTEEMRLLYQSVSFIIVDLLNRSDENSPWYVFYLIEMMAFLASDHRVNIDKEIIIPQNNDNFAVIPGMVVLIFLAICMLVAAKHQEDATKYRKILRECLKDVDHFRSQMHNIPQAVYLKALEWLRSRYREGGDIQDPQFLHTLQAGMRTLWDVIHARE